MNQDVLLKELNFKAVKSSGPGGQHVNKTSTKVVLSFSLSASAAFTEEEKALLEKNLAQKLSSEGVLTLSSDGSRSQLANKKVVVERFLELIKEGLVKPKKRKKTKPSRQAKEKRLQQKKRQAQKKDNRKSPPLPG